MKIGPRYEMTPENLATAIAMAEAATPYCRWGQTEVHDEEWKAILGRGDGNEVWCTWVPEGETSAFAAVTGNGPTSKANALFFAHARDVVLSLGEEVLRLRSIESASQDVIAKLLQFFVTRDPADQERLNQSVVTLATNLGVVSPEQTTDGQEGSNG